jgi:hypothetical protein
MNIYHVAAIGIVAAAILLLVCVLRKRTHIRMGLLGFWLIVSDQTPEQNAKGGNTASKKERQRRTKKPTKRSGESPTSDSVQPDLCEGR